MNNVMDGLIYLGFSKKEAESQLQELNELLAIAMGNIFIKNGDKVKPEEFDSYLKNNYTQEEIEQTSLKTYVKETKEYFGAITKGLSQDKIDKFYEIITKKGSNKP